MPLKTVNLKPMTGILNTRSTPDEVPFGGWRWVQNFRVTQKNTLRRVNGFVKLLDREEYNNQDLHDQLAEAARQPVTLLFNAVSAGTSKLIAGTQNRLYALNNDTGNWVILSNELGGTPEEGCPQKRFRAAQVGDTVVFTNGVDRPVHYTVDQAPLGETDQSVALIDDLATIGISKADIVVGWKGLTILANVVSDGIRVANRLVWSDFERPVSWVPGTESVAGYLNLDPGEAILGIKPMGDFLMVYTTGGIWQGVVTGTDDVLSFQRRYTAGERRNRCLGYPNTLVSTGDDHYYMGQDGIYVYNLYLAEPARVEWIHESSSIIFDDLHSDTCAVPCAGFNAQTKEVWISWPTSDASCPVKTLVINAQYPFVSVMDAGFTAFCNYTESNPTTLRSFLLDRCICTQADLAEGLFGFINEGSYCGEAPVEATCDVTPNSIYTTAPLAIDDETDTEDYTAEEAEEGSLCDVLGGLTFDDICSSELAALECEANQLFVMASTTDKCLKQVSDVLSREFCTDTSGCGTYAPVGYESILRSGPLDFKAPHGIKRLSRFELEAHFPVQTIPSQVALRVGYSARAADPNISGTACDVRWINYTNKRLECLTTLSTQNPYRIFQWPVFAEGDYLYYELKIVNPHSTPVNVGGDVRFSRAALDVIEENRNNT